MMKQTFTILFTAILFFATAQTTADFENFNLGANSSINDSSPDDGFTSGNIFLPNTFTSFPTFDAWSGWAISTRTDSTTAGFTNDQSAITGEGAEGTVTYAVSFNGTNLMHLEGDAAGEIVNGFYITNGTYPYLSMRDGDGFAKKFGGLSGDEPDYFLLTIKAYSGGQLSADSIDFYLADFRFTDNSQDYIIKDWTYIDLTSLGVADSLAFTLTSTDNDPTYGMNTPAYFCIDQLTTSDGTVSNQNLAVEKAFEISPNPASDFIVLKNLETETAVVSIFDLMGKNISNNTITNSNEAINIQHLPRGSYVIKVQQGEKISSQLLIKQ